MEALVEVAIDAGADDVLERRDEHLLDTATAETAEADGASFKLDVWTQPDEVRHARHAMPAAGPLSRGSGRSSPLLSCIPLAPYGSDTKRAQ
eukprot:3327461-Pleurochrysis_carterae.AAC.4